MSLKDELRIRSLVAVVLIPIVLLLVFLGRVYFTTLVAVAFTLAAWEFLNLYKVNMVERYLVVFMLALSIYLAYFGLWQWLLLVFLLFFLPIPLTWNKGVSIVEISLSHFILLYTLVGAISAILIREKLGFGGIAFFLGVIWIFDTMAYLCGYFFGKHKLAVKISPKKTVEGYIYGIFTTLPFGYILHMIKLSPFKSTWQALLFTVILSFLSQIGDLVESTFKRETGVKDSSNIFPGHGGMLDRIDSIVFTAPYFALLTWVFGIWK
ncbi:MAG: phosphatidate cytidylyltransferase [candidate division WOR-3 bacterium]